MCLVLGLVGRAELTQAARIKLACADAARDGLSREFMGHRALPAMRFGRGLLRRAAGAWRMVGVQALLRAAADVNATVTHDWSALTDYARLAHVGAL
jgi:hypothetical protein